MPPAACEAGAEAGALAPPPLEAAGWDALGDGVAPPEQAATTIALIANGAASRRNDCFVVKSNSPLVGMG
jgi:hypothetical protein